MKYVKSFSLYETEQYEDMNEGALMIAGGIILGVLGLKVLKAIVKGILGGIGMHVKVGPDKLKEVVKEIQTKSLVTGKLTGKDLMTVMQWSAAVNKMIDDKEIQTLAELKKAVGAMEGLFEENEYADIFSDDVETLDERNAFLGARAKAIEEDAEEFEFNGKTYPVTYKGDVSESK